MAKPKYHAVDNAGKYWMLDSSGRVWSNAYTTTSGYWTYTGNKVPSSTATNGNGMVYYQASDGTGYIFIFHNSSIDYTKSANAVISWTYQWDPSAGTAAGYASSPSQKLKSLVGANNPHDRDWET